MALPCTFVVWHIYHASYSGDPCQLSRIEFGHGVSVALMVYADNAPTTEEKRLRDNAPYGNPPLSGKQPSA